MDHEKLVEEFCSVTGSTEDQARMFLESNGWNSNLAMASFYEESDEAQMEESKPQANVTQTNNSKPKLPASGTSRIATFSSLKNEDSNDEEEGQAFYAGGSERSGQQVIGPGKRKAGNDVVEEMFKAVRKFGVQVDPNEKTNKNAKAFKGTGFVLGSTADASDTPTAADEAEEASAPRRVEVHLQLWRTGFTVDDGPLRDYTDPESGAFLASIRKGEVPQELRGRGGELHLSIEDRSHDEYVPKRPTVQAFSGTGFRLGNITPVIKSGPSESQEQNEVDAHNAVKADESKPITNIQIRLADGSRLVMKANHDHTIGDVRTFIVLARPGYQAAVFSLMSAYPPKELSDDSATLEEAKMLNSVIVQKLC